ncbi:hypothetical protein [Papillibacter cinnamivorans]|uniref:Uncharacterized protein n=1 Tax=Papillibacter cinnamivorans DSM 12816 TaxID=1122930 RepID=A0A1W2CDL5_9FIRM|nr:hypothetical protein [Papillibacter cinnamivorans]SMC83293.1 hypothetical protein SAMN02745168_2757 [Papillibacter cinnamivorans DSM 12816]
MSNEALPVVLDIFARRILAKAELTQQQEVFQEQYTTVAPITPLGTKAPLRLFIINHDADPTEVPNTDYGSAVKCVKLCKRILDEDPSNTIICTQKSKVIIDFELILIVEYEDNTFDVLTLPRNLSSRLHYSAGTTKAFVESTVIDAAGAPVVQHQNVSQPYEALVIRSTGVNAYTNFEYTVNIPISSFSTVLRKCELDDPSLQSYILLRNLDYEVDVLDPFQVFINADNTQSIWTTEVEFSLYEDIIDKLGIDQDVRILGTPEYVCTDDCSCP